MHVPVHVLVHVQLTIKLHILFAATVSSAGHVSSVDDVSSAVPLSIAVPAPIAVTMLPVEQESAVVSVPIVDPGSTPLPIMIAVAGSSGVQSCNRTIVGQAIATLQGQDPGSRRLSLLRVSHHRRTNEISTSRRSSKRR